MSGCRIDLPNQQRFHPLDALAHEFRFIFRLNIQPDGWLSIRAAQIETLITYTDPNSTSFIDGYCLRRKFCADSRKYQSRIVQSEIGFA